MKYFYLKNYGSFCPIWKKIWLLKQNSKILHHIFRTLIEFKALSLTSLDPWSHSPTLSTNEVDVLLGLGGNNSWEPRLNTKSPQNPPPCFIWFGNKKFQLYVNSTYKCKWSLIITKFYMGKLFVRIYYKTKTFCRAVMVMPLLPEFRK